MTAQIDDERKAKCQTIRLRKAEKELAQKLVAYHKVRGLGPLFVKLMNEEVDRLKKASEVKVTKQQTTIVK